LDFGSGLEDKFFVLLGNIGAVAYLIKATSKTPRYENNARLMDGCVCYEAGACVHFPLRTIIEPDNQFAVRHSDLIDHASQGRLRVCGPLPSDFEDRLRRAIEYSVTLDGRQRRWLRRFVP
jgi:hypothetical protein